MSDEEEALQFMRSQHEHLMMERELWVVRNPWTFGIIMLVIGVTLFSIFGSSNTAFDAASTNPKQRTWHREASTTPKP